MCTPFERLFQNIRLLGVTARALQNVTVQELDPIKLVGEPVPERLTDVEQKLLTIPAVVSAVVELARYCKKVKFFTERAKIEESQKEELKEKRKADKKKMKEKRKQQREEEADMNLDVRFVFLLIINFIFCTKNAACQEK